MAIAIKNPFIRFVNNENKDKSSEKYPPKLPVRNKMIIGIDATANEYETILRNPILK